MTAPSVRTSVCIVSWNVREDLLACLHSLVSAAKGVPVEVIVADNASADGTVDVVRKQFPEVKLICNQSNLGFAAATNQAMAAACGQFLLLLNPDTILPEGALGDVLDAADTHPEAGIVAPKLLNPDGTLQHSCRRFPTPAAALFRHTVLGRLFPNNRWAAEYVMADWPHEEVREVDWVSGACMLVRRDLYDEIGPLDEGFFWGCEDVDYCLRAHRAGWKVVYAPRPAIVHRIGASSDQRPDRTVIDFHRSMLRLYRKHFARTWLHAAVMWVAVWLRAGLLIGSRHVRAAWGRLLRALGRRGEARQPAGETKQ
jgi:GT2 family glycosyltransferase